MTIGLLLPSTLGNSTTQGERRPMLRKVTSNNMSVSTPNRSATYDSSAGRREVNSIAYQRFPIRNVLFSKGVKETYVSKSVEFFNPLTLNV